MTGPIDDRGRTGDRRGAFGGRGDERSTLRRYAPVAVVGLAALGAAAQFLLFPTEPASPVDVLGEGSVVVGLGVALFVVSRVDETGIYRPLMGGVTVLFVFALTDVLDEFVTHPEWFGMAFEDGAQVAGTVLLVVGLYRWTVASRDREAELRRRSERLAVLNRVLQHDIRNDTMVIRGWASVLRKEQGRAADDRLDRIVDASNGIIELTESVAEFTDALTSAEPADLEPKPLAATVEDEIAKVRARYEGASVEVDGDLPDVDVLAHSMLPVVFRNLLVNAVEHNDATTPEVRVSAELESETVAVRVADNGPGIPDDRKGRLFDAGGTVLQSPDDRVGLSLVGALVEQFDGEISVTDSTGGGTAVVVRIPVADPAQGTTDRPITDDVTGRAGATDRPTDADGSPDVDPTGNATPDPTVRSKRDGAIGPDIDPTDTTKS